jgi:hypothetical protein
LIHLAFVEECDGPLGLAEDDDGQAEEEKGRHLGSAGIAGKLKLLDMSARFILPASSL